MPDFTIVVVKVDYLFFASDSSSENLFFEYNLNLYSSSVLGVFRREIFT